VATPSSKRKSEEDFTQRRQGTKEKEGEEDKRYSSNKRLKAIH
jgi:hypothetical protein